MKRIVDARDCAMAARQPTTAIFARARLCAVIAVVWLMTATGPLLAYPEVGTPAPPLQFTQLLQAPPGARVEWPALKGKVVVLEFWATWCAPCVASIPHLNELAASLDPAKVQFISIDNEDPKIIRAFLAKKKMSGWLGVDTTGGVTAWYGANSLPTTIIVGTDGKVVAATSAESLQAADLLALAEGRKVAFKPAMEDIKTGAASAVNVAASSMAAVSLSRAAADAKPATVYHAPTGTDLLGVDADSLITNVFDITEERYVLAGSLPQGPFDLRVNVPDVDGAAAKGMVKQALLAGLRMKVQPKTITRRAYVLRREAEGGKAPDPPASNHKTMRGYWHGRYVVISATMDDLAYVLATGLQNPVVNETGIDSKFDVRFKVAADSVEELNAVLRKMLGVELVEGGAERSITLQELSAVEGKEAR